MRTPTIHNNGTGADDLLAQYQAAVIAVRAAAQVVQAIDVNGRDYYPQGEYATNEARQEQVDRLRRLDSVQDELMTIWHSIDERKMNNA